MGDATPSLHHPEIEKARARARRGSIIIGCQHPRVCARNIRARTFRLTCHSIHSRPSHLTLPPRSFSRSPFRMRRTAAVVLFPLSADPAARINKIKLLFPAANASRRTKCDSKRKKETGQRRLGGARRNYVASFESFISRRARVWSCATSKERRIEINDYQR